MERQNLCRFRIICLPNRRQLDFSKLARPFEFFNCSNPKQIVLKSGAERSYLIRGREDRNARKNESAPQGELSVHLSNLFREPAPLLAYDLCNGRARRSDLRSDPQDLSEIQEYRTKS